jgi:predicted aldo/keto reductase-like oxidoreductase
MPKTGSQFQIPFFFSEFSVKCPWLIKAITKNGGMIMTLNRREFIKISAATTAALSLGTFSLKAESKNGMPHRVLGKTGLEVSLLTLGGHTIGVEELSEKESIKIMRTAIDEGINFFDNAWEYHDGRSEELMGKALSDGYRQKVILMTKHHGRDPKVAQQHLEDSLRRLKTDVIDVWQFHEIDEDWEIESIYSSGVLDFALKVKEEGKIKHIGFTGHFRPAMHLEMIYRGFDWETVQMPINILDRHFLSFSNNVLPVTVKKNIGVIAMKTLAGPPGVIPKEGIAKAEDAHRFAMTLPISTLCSGMDSLEVLHKNLKTVREFKPMTADEMTTLLAGVIKFSMNGKYEGYKTYTPGASDEEDEEEEA